MAAIEAEHILHLTNFRIATVLIDVRQANGVVLLDFAEVGC